MDRKRAKDGDGKERVVWSKITLLLFCRVKLALRETRSKRGRVNSKVYSPSGSLTNEVKNITVGFILLHQTKTLKACVHFTRVLKKPTPTL